jgi:hypothetical protein
LRKIKKVIPNGSMLRVSLSSFSGEDGDGRLLPLPAGLTVPGLLLGISSTSSSIT